MNPLASWASKSLVFAALFLGAASAFAGSVTVQGGLPKVLSSGQIPLTFVVTGILDADHTKGLADATDMNANFIARFNVKLPDFDNAKPIALKKADAGVTSACNCWIYPTQAHTEERSNDGLTWTYTYYVTIEATQSSFTDVVNKSAALKLDVYFYLGDQTKANYVGLTAPDPTTITKEAYVVDDVPKFEAIAVQGSNRQVTVKWVHKDNVNVKGINGAASQKPAGDVTVYVIDSTVTSSATLPAHSSSLDINKPDTAASCTFTAPAAESGACITCVGDNVYLDPAEVNGVAGFRALSTGSKEGQLTAANLENNRKYWVFLQYQPQGTQESLCVGGIPTPNYSLTEINGEGEAKYVDFRCFIATAAYGSPLHADVRLFRKFRDDVLLKSSWGRSFVDIYYEYSPVAADFIARHESLRKVTRGALALPAWILRELEPVDEI